MVLLSRAETPETKVRSVAIAVLVGGRAILPGAGF